jgi:hypothetical protein
VSKDAFKVKSFHQDLNIQGVDTRGHSHTYMNTEMMLETTEFENFHYKGDEHEEPEQELVFCIKEMKALLSLCEQVEGMMPLSMLFCGTGNPMKFSSKSLEFEVSLIMATLEKKHLRTMHSSQFTSTRENVVISSDNNDKNGHNFGRNGGTKRSRIEEEEEEEEEGKYK